MAKTLDVYLNRNLCGYLVQDAHGQMRFQYAQAWLGNPKAVPLSHSLPLRGERFSSRECRGFFGGILPEANNREVIAHNLGISPRNDFAMLEQLGGECAGAVMFLPSGVTLPERDDRYRNLGDKDLAEILRTLPRRPLLAGEEGIRLSLAGAQDKLAVYASDGHISIPLWNAPSTHILKPSIERFAETVFNEAFCMKLARAIGLTVADLEIDRVEDIDYLLVERYDRHRVTTISGEPMLERLHQEDFCQALGVVSENKYENEGGPSLKKCFALLREISAAPVIDLQRLLDAVIFNFLIRNRDAHGKNFSILYDEKASTRRLAPLYDLLSTSFYPELSIKMAMKIGGEYGPDRIRPQHFDRLAEDAGLAKPLVKRRVQALAEMVLAKIPGVAAGHSKMSEFGDFIQGQITRLRATLLQQ
jgi:serine/threonine-protein kinase HipA